MKNAFFMGEIKSLETIHNFVDCLNNLPIRNHVYGQPQKTPSEYPHWMKYCYDGGDDYIMFSRNTILVDGMNEIASYVIQMISNLGLPLNEEFLPRVHFLKTFGNVTPHRDEAGRKSCINIGILNSSSASTRFSLNDSFQTFSSDYEEMRMVDGSVYLINTNCVHAVNGEQKERLLITVGFGAPYDTLLSRFSF